ncbi:MAG: signal peptidase II [Acidimicrobiales bacterium]
MQERRAVAALRARDKTTCAATTPLAVRDNQVRPSAAQVVLSRSLSLSADRARRRRAVGAAVAAGVVAVDQVTKTLALGGLDDGPVHLVWTLQLRLTFNRGAAFGLGPGLSPILVVVGVVVLLGLLATGRTMVRSLAMVVALGLVTGGAVGNLVDRVARDHGGAVVDFVDLQWWPVFNVADAAITVGALVLVLASRK